MARRKLVAGNWKMHGLAADLGEVIAASKAAETANCDVALCLPATLIERAVRAAPHPTKGIFPDPILRIGAQDVHREANGAHTGCISAPMLLDAGASITIVGHSERREAQCETDADVKAKAEMGLSAGLWVILCVGETLEKREAGQAVETVTRQLEQSLPRSPIVQDFINTSFSVAYEPIWAIGTGRIPTMDDIREMHAKLRGTLIEAYGGEAGNNVRILYGGSVKASNAVEIFAVPDVDGALVGGASLKASDFLPIVEAAGAR
jgi:triosephosphate isomerase